MTKQQVKLEIEKILKELSAEELVDVLAYLKILESGSPAKARLSRNLLKILREDAKVLKRLAE